MTTGILSEQLFKSKPKPNPQRPESHYSVLENEAIAHMAERGFHFDGPFDLSGKSAKFIGRLARKGSNSKDDVTEWYKASEQISTDGRVGLLVTYNSHHPDLKKEKGHHVFNSKSSKPLSENELKDQRKRVAERQKNKVAADKAKENKRMMQAYADRERFNKACKTGNSAYLDRKGIPDPCGARFEKKISAGIEETILLIPMRDENNEVQALQEIYPTKRIFPGEDKARDKNSTNAVKGLFNVLGVLVNGKPIRVSEGFATSVSCYISTGCNIAHVTAFSDGAYATLIPKLRLLYPDSPIQICADGSKEPGKKCSGIIEAEKAVKAIENSSFVYPVFKEGKDRDESGNRYKDFNDLMLSVGKEEVARQLSATKPSAESDQDEIEDSDANKNELIKARVSARRRALLQRATCEEIVNDIRKQHVSLSNRAEEIASKAISWAESYKTGCETIVDGIPKKITDMESLDLRFAQLEAPGQPCVTIHRADAQPISDKDFNKRLNGEVVLSGVDAKGFAKYTAASVFWNGNAHKKVYRRIAFANQPVDDNTYNLFTGFGVKPKNGTCDRIFAHTKDVICAGDDVNNTALLKLLAWQIQNIGKPSRIITALKSKAQQVGKGCFLADILAVIFGSSGFVTSDLSQIITRFNDTLRGKAFIFLDEALFAGDRKAADAIKALATTTIMGIESKGVQTVQCPIAVNLFLATNHEDAAHVEEADARYWILEVSPHRVGDVKYFSELYAEIESGGREAFMYYLLNLDVKDFIPSRDVPKDNVAKEAMIRNSINPYDARKWLEACCRAEMILGYKPPVEMGVTSKSPWELWQKGAEYTNGILSVAYDEWQKTVKSPVGPKPTPGNKFGELLNDAGFDLRIDRQRWRTLPDPNECLKVVLGMIEKSGKK